MDQKKVTEAMQEKAKEVGVAAQETARRIFTAAHLRKAGAALAVCAVLAGGGAWYHHQQEQVQHASVCEARTAMITAQAAQRSLELLTPEQIRSLAAEAVGVDETSLTYKEISLIDAVGSAKEKAEKADKHDKHEKHEKHNEEAEHEDYEPPYAAPQPEAPAAQPTDAAAASAPAMPAIHKHPGSADYAALAQSQAQAAEPVFQPIYKVSCRADQVKYKLYFDAVTGQLLGSHIG